VLTLTTFERKFVSAAANDEIAVATSHHGLQERLQANPAGRLVISAFVIVVVTATVLWNLPDSEIRRVSLPVLQPLMQATGLQQKWGVFSPDPRTQVIDLVARFEYADGTTGAWRPPDGNPLVGGYRTYRWRKWSEDVRLNDERHLWVPAAAWALDSAEHQGREPVQVTLVRRWRDVAPPGTENDEGWREFTMLTATPAELAPPP
jgi:hypothetical protein